jgi:AcrR family transcriptional regulator
MGHKHTKEEMLGAAVATAFEHGLSMLTFGRVAAHLGVSDRMVVYYFPTKEVLLGDVLAALGLRLQDELAMAFTTKVADHRELIARAWPLLAQPSADPVFALYFEASGLAAAGREPYDQIVPQLVDGWIAWAAELVGGDAKHRRVEAAAAVAVLDGLLLLRQVAGASVASRAAHAVGA